MYENLPDDIKQQVLFFLQEDDFPSAKDVHDNWMNNYRQPSNDKLTFCTIDQSESDV